VVASQRRHDLGASTSDADAVTVVTARLSPAISAPIDLTERLGASSSWDLSSLTGSDDLATLSVFCPLCVMAMG